MSLSLGKLNGLLHAIGIKAPCLSLSQLSGGRQHKTYLASFAKQTWVVKQLAMVGYWGAYSPQHFEQIEQFAYELQQTLGQQIVAAEKINNRFVHEWEGAPYVIYPYIDGTSYSVLSQTKAYYLGQWLAKFHQCHYQSSYFSPSLAINFSPNELELQRLTQLSVSSLPIETLLSLAGQSAQARAACRQPRLISHRDLNLSNILWSADNQPYFIDWESAGLMCPGVELLGLAFNVAGIESGLWESELFFSTIQGYCSVAALPVIDKTIYLQAYATWFAWMNYCLKQASTLSDVHTELSLSLSAIELMYRHRREIIMRINNETC